MVVPTCDNITSLLGLTELWHQLCFSLFPSLLFRLFHLQLHAFFRFLHGLFPFRCFQFQRFEFLSFGGRLTFLAVVGETLLEFIFFLDQLLHLEKGGIDRLG